MNYITYSIINHTTCYIQYVLEFYAVLSGLLSIFICFSVVSKYFSLSLLDTGAVK